MRKTKRLASTSMTILALGLLGPGLTGPVAAGDLPSADKVIAKFNEAIGGKALDQVGNMSAEIRFEMPMNGVYATAYEYWKKPLNHYIRIDLASSGVADYEAGVVDGVAWQTHPMSGTRKLAGDEERQALRQASRNWLADWKSLFETAETAAEEVVREKPCYRVVFTPKEGQELNAYFDTETGLLVRQEALAPTGSRIIADLDDWEETQGILSARTVSVRGPDSYTLKYTAVAYDVEDLPEDSFELPASLRAAE